MSKRATNKQEDMIGFTRPRAASQAISFGRRATKRIQSKREQKDPDSSKSSDSESDERVGPKPTIELDSGPSKP